MSGSSPKTRTPKQQETEICRYIRGTPKTLYDIGVGLKTEWKHIPEKYPSINVFGCEPCEKIRNEVIKKGFNGVMLPVGIGAPGQSQTTLRIGYQLGCRDSSIHPIPNFSREETIDLITLDQFDEQCLFPKDILLWMDIEGYELVALKSGPELLTSGRVRWINLEVHVEPKASITDWPTSEAIHTFLSDHGYDLAKKYNNHGTHHDRIYVSRGNP